METLTRVWLQRKQVQQVKDPDRYIFGIAKNVCRDIQRRNARIRKLVGQLAQDKADHEADTWKTVMRHLDAEAIHQAVSELENPKQRQALELYLQDFTQSEIAQHMQADRKQVNRWQQLGRHQLRKTLTRKWGTRAPTI